MKIEINQILLPYGLLAISLERTTKILIIILEVWVWILPIRRRIWLLLANSGDSNSKCGSGAISGKMLPVRSVENNWIDDYFRAG